MQASYKNSHVSKLAKERNSDNKSDNSLDTSAIDLFSQNISDLVIDYISLAIEEYHNNDYRGYFDQINFINSFFNELCDACFDIDALLPDIYNPNLNFCLRDSINPESFDCQDIITVLSLISILSSYSKNYEYFEKSSILKCAYDLMNVNQFFYQNCILIISKYIQNYESSSFQLDLPFLIKALIEVSKNMTFSQYSVEALKKIILNIDTSRYKCQILHLMNKILLKTKSIITLNGIIDLIKDIFNIDPLNFALIIQSRIIHNFVELLNKKFLKKPTFYNSVILNFFEFINYSFEMIDMHYQEITIKVIEIDTFSNVFEKVHDNKIIFIIHLIFIQYIYAHRFEMIFFNEGSPFIAYIFSINLIENLVSCFNDQNYKIKKQILLIIQKLLKTQSNELFHQLLNNNQSNYFVSCADFALNNDDTEVQEIVLDSILSLIQIGERNSQKQLISSSSVAYEFVSNCFLSENQHIQELSKEIFDLINKK